MARVLTITCSGDHLVPVELGSCTVPDGVVTVNLSGYLCEDCGPAYADAVQTAQAAPGQVPSKKAVDDYLARTKGKRKNP